MIEWITVISLILFGLFLIIAEIIFVPGTTLVGILGFIFLLLGVGLSFNYFGSETGWTTVGVSAVASGLILFYSFKANIWGRFSLKCQMPGQMKMCQTSIPYFTDMIIMSFACDYCGAHSTETKNTGIIKDEGCVITLKADS